MKQFVTKNEQGCNHIGTNEPLFKLWDDFQPLQSTSQGYFKPKMITFKSLNGILANIKYELPLAMIKHQFKYFCQIKHD